MIEYIRRVMRQERGSRSEEKKMNASRKIKRTEKKKKDSLFRKLNEKIDIRKIVHTIGTILFIVLPPAVCFYLLEFYTHNPFEEVRPWAQLFNMILFELTALILFCVSGSLKIAHRILFTAAMLFGIANAYVVRFRTNPIVPWDIFSWRTAASVADNYEFMPDARMVMVTLVFLAVILLLRFEKVRINRFVIWKRLIPAGMLAVVLVLFSQTLQQESFQNSHRLYNKLFTPVFMTDVDGIAVTFVMNLTYMTIDKPDGYSSTEAQAILSSYEEETQAEELPNVIVVMNEAFSDLAILGDFKTNEDYMPFVHSLQRGAQDTVTGMLNVSVCGGNTANTEFEFLTGNTMAFLPQGSIPYQQYITGDLQALPSYLRSLGYQTIATHPYNATGWERNTVYPWLGFSESVFKEGYADAEYVRQYVSDAGCVDKIIEFYENKETGKPLFAFNVTMQNHGGYSELYENFTPDITVEESQNDSLNQYLSLIKLSDASLEQLVNYFAGVDEKTVIVFFGDHQPNDTVASTILSMNGMRWNALSEEEQKLRYQVPYVMWANYDIEEEQNADTSVNYLAAEVLERAGIPLDTYQKYLTELKEDYPIISAIRTVKADGSESSASEEIGEMDIYRKLQYFEIFDQGNE